MMDAALDFQETLFDAQSQGGSTRQRHLRQADAALNKLRLYLRLAHRWHWLNDRQYQHVSTLGPVKKLFPAWVWPLMGWAAFQDGDAS
jgi:hypothetical protein